MDYNRIDAALRDASDTHHLLIGTGVLNDVGNVLEQAFGQQPVVVVADDNTYAVAGKAVYERLRSTTPTVEEPIVFPVITCSPDRAPTLYASFENVLALEESLAKYITPDQLRQRLMLIQERWPIIREHLERQLMTAEHIRDLLRAAGCPTEPAEIGVSVAQLRESYILARTIRSRYTVLDLVNESGILDACVDELFAPGGYWAGITHA